MWHAAGWWCRWEIGVGKGGSRAAQMVAGNDKPSTNKVKLRKRKSNTNKTIKKIKNKNNIKTKIK
jgi:hypothetical protein